MTNGRGPLFGDLIFNDDGEVARTVFIGGVPYYAIPEGDFLRHVEAEYVDRQVIAHLKDQFLAMRDTIVSGVSHMMGGEDLFTRPVIEHAIEHMDQILTAGGVDVDQLRAALWMTKFRVTVDLHGDVLEVEMPGAEDGGDDGE
jgi:hypothetical protein